MPRLLVQLLEFVRIEIVNNNANNANRIISRYIFINPPGKKDR